MLLPAPVLSILSRLRAAGFSAYAVGGCVRDSLLGKAPGDWDICTSALPEEMQQVFCGRARGGNRPAPRHPDRGAGPCPL